MDQKGKKMDKERVLEFISKEVLQLESHIEKQLLKQSFEGKGVKLVVMMDGFDEISPNHKETVIEMLQVLKQTSLEQLWVTTRPHLKEDLEDNLQQLSYTLQPFSDVQQVEFLKKLWPQHFDSEDTDHDRREIYAEALIRKLAQSISDKDREFTGIPLQTRMLAEAFEEGFRSFCQSKKSKPDLPHKLDLLELYKKFIDRKYNIYYQEKSKRPAGNVAIEELTKRDFKFLQEVHQKLALQALFTEDDMPFLDNPVFSNEELARIGIAHRNHEDKPQFIHRTFAEYYVADFLINHLIKGKGQDKQVLEFLLNMVLLRTECLIIRALLDGLLEHYRPSEEALKECGKELDEQWNKTKVHGTLTGDTTVLRTAAAEDNDHIIEFLLQSIKSTETLSPLSYILAIDDEEVTAMQIATKNRSVRANKKLEQWIRILTSNLRLH